jgi:hypothetical protein
MKMLHKLILPLVAIAALTFATPAQAHRFHRHGFVGGYYGRGYPSYGYYSPYYSPYYGYYGGPYYGGYSFGFGGHGGYSHRGYGGHGGHGHR